MSSVWLIVFKKLLNLLIKIEDELSLVDTNMDKFTKMLFSTLNRKKVKMLRALISLIIILTKLSSAMSMNKLKFKGIMIFLTFT